ncbi:hypothetical protein Poly30_50080 [Planctomycetes bacterium Poly30]|uniref:Uncharacterized protein n=1 Tax=Saltatorellus ferox TaxID=2528018 RepID=A0A518EZC7_9BACT|nr:hypothetical protein Poly30_50080 [Planctomycetes bacterium Poly30]
MGRLLQCVLAVVALTLCASCSNLRTFQHEVTPWGGHDGAGGADQIYFELRNVKGLEGGGLSALELPEDWPERPVRRDDEGRAILDPPLEPTWRFGRAIQPAVVLASRGNVAPGTLSLYGTEHSPMKVPVVIDPSNLDDATARAATRLSAGASAYALVDDSPDEERRHRVYRLVGARLDARGEVEWVQLLSLEFEDSRNALERGLDVPLRQWPTLDVALIVAALIWPVFVFG